MGIDAFKYKSGKGLVNYKTFKVIYNKAILFKRIKRNRSTVSAASVNVVVLTYKQT